MKGKNLILAEYDKCGIPFMSLTSTDASLSSSIFMMPVFPTRAAWCSAVILQTEKDRMLYHCGFCATIKLYSHVSIIILSEASINLNNFTKCQQIMSSVAKSEVARFDPE